MKKKIRINRRLVNAAAEQVVTIMNGSTFTDNKSFTDKLRRLSRTYIAYAYQAGAKNL